VTIIPLPQLLDFKDQTSIHPHNCKVQSSPFLPHNLYICARIVFLSAVYFVVLHASPCIYIVQKYVTHQSFYLIQIIESYIRTLPHDSGCFFFFFFSYSNGERRVSGCFYMKKTKRQVNRICCFLQ
jgi:hypothetical protein